MDFVCSDYNWIWGLITDIILNICLVSQTQQFFTKFFTTKQKAILTLRNFY